jgi:sugar O-acyltransferase (sialic acid O-acetyltransferase NeuD family)
MENKKVWPQYTEKMKQNITQILESGKVNQWTGTKVKEFEKKYTEYFNVKYAVAVTNGTVALDLCLKAIDIKSNDEIIVTPRSFVASASSISSCGGIPVFVDIDTQTQNITLENIKKGVSNKTKAVILVHLAGLSCDCTEIVEWCHQNNIYVIEDCAQAHGAKYNNQYVGTFGDINAWSFCQDKIISTGGEGGMITTNNEELFKKAWSYKDHGKNYDKIFKDTKDSIPGFFRYVHDSIGTNWRMMEFQASIGIDSLELLNDWVKIRQRNAKILSECLKKYSFIKILEYPDKYYHSYYKYYFYIDDNVLGFKQIRNLIIKKFIENGINANQGSCSEIYNEKCYQNNNNHRIAMDCINAKKVFEQCIILQIDPTYTEEIMTDLIQKINIVLTELSNNMLFIIGCGQHSKVVTDIAIDSKYNFLGYLDDNYNNMKDYEYRKFKCIGTIDDILTHKICCKWICGIGDTNIRNKIIDKIENKIEPISIIHTSAIISPTVTIKSGTIIMPRVVINSDTKISHHCIINTGAIIEHDCTIGKNTHIAPNSTICGGIEIGDNVLFGAGSVSKNSTHNKKIKIGNNVTIGCGSVITKCIEDNVIVYGKI